MTVLAAIRHNLAGLLRFSGRDDRATFWPYVAAIMIVSTTVAMLVMVPVMIDAMQKMLAFAEKHPDQATVERSGTSISVQIDGFHPELMPDFGALIIPWAVTSMVVVLLLAAAVTRRLHDGGRSGLWGLMPVPFLIIGMVMLPRLIATGDPDLNGFFALFVNNLVYLALLALLVFFLAKPGQPDANRYGDPPPY